MPTPPTTPPTKQAGFTVAKIAARLGTNTTVCTLAFWDRATHELRHAFRPPGEYTLHAVLHRDAYMELRHELKGGLAMAAGLGSGPFDGFTLHVSDSVPVGDTTGHLNIVGAVLVGLGSGATHSEGLLWGVDRMPGVIPMAVGVTFVTRGSGSE